jgi:hypothetical protein
MKADERVAAVMNISLPHYHYEGPPGLRGRMCEKPECAEWLPLAEPQELIASARALRARVASLTEALRKYGHHVPVETERGELRKCRYEHLLRENESDCDCGLFAALEPR